MVVRRDGDGFAASVEARFPLYSRGPTLLELAPFMDAGRTWNDGASGDAETLWSVGLGLRWRMRSGAGLELYWGESLDNPPETFDHDLQDDGIHFRFWSVR